MKPEATNETLTSTSDSVGADLLQALVQELKLLPDVWVKISESKQNDIIDRLRHRVQSNVATAVHAIASDNRATVIADLENVSIKEEIKATFRVSRSNAIEPLHGLYSSINKSCLLIVVSTAEHTAGMDEIKGESDQRAMDLGHEYDPNGDGKGMEGHVVDVEAKAVAITNQHLQSELEQAYGAGNLAAQEGRPQSDCPLMAGALCIEWVKGWKTWHEENPSADPVKTAKLGELPNDAGVYVCEPDETDKWEHKKHRASYSLIELENGKWVYGCSVCINDGGSNFSPSNNHIADSRDAAIEAIREELDGHSAELTGKALESFTEFVDWIGQDNT
jgi:hypothetical protein